ncbi:MAG: lysophospholipid acyltransferase family protein [Candidatus Hydrogenedentes bacterium]|nr:lysophospholipid acyltransferase family protein [Candidatus Hydrogenedentota bacterium]
MIHPELDYSNPITFTFRQRVALFFIPLFIAIAMRVIGHTCTVIVRNPEYHERAEQGFGCVVLAVWHEMLPLGAWCYRNRGYHTLTSYSYDGELAARVIRYIGLDAVRGSSSRGGHDALRRLQTAIEQRVTIGLTLDGPRGPRRESKPGVAILAARTGVPVVPAAFGASSCWRLKSWDRMVIPKPFSRIVCVYGPPIAVTAEDDSESIERNRAIIESTLRGLQEEVDREMNSTAEK